MTGWWRDAFGQPGIRALGVAWFASLVATFSVTVATLVFAYAEGGAALVAYFGIASTAPGAVLSPVLMGQAARTGSDIVLRRTTALRTLLIVAAAAAAAAELAAPLVVTLVALAVALGSTFRPTQASLLPWLARTPQELTAANVAATVAENSAALSGPVLAGALLTWADSTATMGLAAAFMALATLALARLQAPPEARAMTAGPAGGLLREAVSGLRALFTVAPPAGIVVVAFTQTFVRGAVMVLLIVLALDELALGESSVGWLNAAMGLGGLVGAAVGARVVRLTRLGRCLIAGILLWALGVLVLGLAPGFLLAFAAIAVFGVGNALEDASGFTLMPRAVGPRLAGQTLGAFELVVMVGVGTGALAAPALAGWLGVRDSLVLLGAALGVVTLGYLFAFARVDREVKQPPPGADLLRGLPIFSPLPIVVVEDLADSLEESHFEAGSPVVVEGSTGERYHLVTEGSASVDVQGVHRRTLGPGDGFGEIALLRDVPRTATVTADTDLTTLSLERKAFLTAVTLNQASRIQAEQLVAARLADDPEADARP